MLSGRVFIAFDDRRRAYRRTKGKRAKSSKRGYNAKINIGADGNYIELAENALYSGSKEESGKHGKFHQNAKTWDYYVKIIKCDERYYDVLINVKDTGNNQYVYDVTLKEAASLPAPRRSYDGSSAASVNSIPQNATKKYSLDEDSLDIRHSIEIDGYYLKEKMENLADHIQKKYGF